ncbi:MAG TPA: hypothetical protein VGE64_10135 [Xanthomonadaceae bacterium]
MSAALRDIVQRNVALGLRFWDVAAATSLVDGLVVEVFPQANPHARRHALPNPSAIYVAHALAGLRAFEGHETRDDDPVDEPWRAAREGSPPLAAGYRIEVRDPRGRFLPIAFDADLPARGLLSWLAPWLSPPQPIALPGTSPSSPQVLLDRIPLFSAPSRPTPEPLAVVRAQMREAVGGRVAAWALLGVEIDGDVVGLGLADREGRVAVHFPYPEPPRTPLSSPPEARSDFRWIVGLTAYASSSSPPVPPSEVPMIPDLADVLAQLASPRAVVDGVVSPVPPRRLEYRVPMTARTEGQPEADASWLLLSPA